MRRPLIAGNWKMHGTRAENAELIEALLLGLPGQTPAEIVVCPPFVYLWETGRALKASSIGLGAQSTCAESVGAFTGEVSAAMLKDVGCRYVIVGHSERRVDHYETDAQVCAKAQAAWRAGLISIVCVGEQQRERESGTTVQVVEQQLAASVPKGATSSNLVIAYEPVWAIGTGLTPTPKDIAEVHGVIRNHL